MPRALSAPRRQTGATIAIEKAWLRFGLAGIRPRGGDVHPHRNPLECAGMRATKQPGRELNVRGPAYVQLRQIEIST
jgi:hypothetical protein